MAVPPGVDPHEVLGVASGAPPADVTAAYRRLAKRWHPDRAPAAGASDRMALINAAYDELRTDGHGSSRARARSRAATPTADGTGSTPPSWPPRGPGPHAPPGSRAGAADPHGRGRRGRPAEDDPRGPSGPAATGTGTGGWAAGVFASAAAADAGPGTDADGLAPAVARALGGELRTALEPGEEVGLVVPASTWASPQTTLAVTDRRILWLLDDAPVHRVRVLPFSDVVAVDVVPPRLWRRRAQVVCTDRRGRRTAFGELEPATAAAVARRVRVPPAGRAASGAASRRAGG